MTTPEARYARLKTTAVSVWAAIGVLVLLAVVLWGLGRIWMALIPFVMAFIIAFLLNWPVKALAARGVPRGYAALLCLAVGLLLFGLAVTLLAPPVTRQVVELARSWPSALPKLELLVNQVQGRFSRLVIPDWTQSAVQSATSQLSDVAVRAGNSAAEVIVTTGGGVATGFFDIFIALVIAYWALKDLPKLREEILVISGPKYHDDTELLINTVTKVVGGYLKGQTIASLATGTLATIGLAVIGVPYALVLGILTFFLNYIPYVGPFTSGLVAGLVAVVSTGSGWKGLFAVLVIVVAQNFTDTVITPRVMSEQVDLHPILVILSLLIGASLFGIAGMLFAIPVAATGKGLFVYYYERRTKRQLATEDGAFFRGTGCDSPDDEPCDPELPDGMAL